MFRNVFFICMVLIPASMASHYAMAADSCQPVFDALTMVVITPSHSYTTHTAAAAHGGTEKIYVDGKIYIRASGKWMQSPVTIAVFVSHFDWSLTPEHACSLPPAVSR